MAYDGSIILDTSIDTAGAQKGLTSLGGLVTAGVAAAATALAGLGVAAVKVGSDFEAAMSQVEAISGASGQSLQSLNDIAKEMGETTKFSATESAEALKYMAMAGWDAEQMVSGLPGVMHLAAAAGEDLATVSDIVTDAMTAFGMEAEQSAHFADVLAAAATSSNTNVGMMGETFKYVAPLAGALNYSIEDTSVAIGLMANASIKGSQAGTDLRSILTRLVKPTKESGAAMEALGISAINADGSMKPLLQLLEELREALGKTAIETGELTEAEQSMYAAMLGGQRAMSSLLAIVNASEEDFQDLTDAIYNADGAAQRMADTMNDNLQGKMVLLKSALEGTGIAIYEGLQEPFKDAAQSSIDAVGRMTQSFRSPEMQGALNTLARGFADTAASALDLAASALPKVVSGFAVVVENGQSVLAVTAGMATAFVSFKTVSTVVPVIQKMAAAWGTAAVQVQLFTMTNGAAALSQAALSGSLTITEIAVAALSGKINLVVAAQALWNATVAAHPIGALAVGVAALTAALVAITIATRDSESELTRLKKTTQEVVDSTNQLIEKIDSSSSAYRENSSDIRTHIGAAEQLAAKIRALSGVENKSAEQKQRLASTVEQLNQLMPELNLQYNIENDLVSKSNEGIGQQIEKRMELMRVEADQARQIEIVKELIELEDTLGSVKDQRNDISTKLAASQEEKSESAGKLAPMDYWEPPPWEPLPK